MKAAKYLLYGVAALVVLAAVALGAAVTIVDGAFVKARLERAMKEKNRTLRIEGEPKLRLFPIAGIALGATSLSEPGSEKAFVTLDSAEVAVRVAPLLSGEVVVETLTLAGLKVNVVRGKDGRMNFADLAGGEHETESRERSEPPKLRVAEMNIERAQLSYRDAMSGQEITLGELNLKTGRLDGDVPGPVSFSAHLSGRHPESDLRAQAGGALRFNLARQEVGLDGFSAQLKGRLERDTLSAELNAPKVEITPARASGSAVTATVKLTGPQRSFDAKLRIAAVEGSATALVIPSLALELAASISGTQVKAQAQGAIKANLQKRTLDADLTAKLDDSAIRAKLGVTDTDPLKAAFDASVDRIDLDRYLPAREGGSKTDEAIDLSVLKGKTVTGKVQIDALTVKRAKLQNVKAEIKLAGGKLEVAPHSATLYGGTLAGTLSADANGNRVHLKETAQNVAIGSLLRDVARKDVLDGRGNLSLDVQAAGATVPALKKALSGSARVELKDAAVKGVNLADSARNLKSALGGKQAKPEASQKTDFSEMSASFSINNGVAHNDDLKAASPFLRLGGAGNLDIGANAIDYLAKATLAATSKGQGGRAAGDVAGVTIPVKLTGPLDNPAWNIDYSGLLGGVAAGAAGVAETVKKGAGGVGDAVRGLFKR
ncbi:MAG: AsmA family protein [Betaproteobacteria bacterium]|nr:AsmA family protein [Betaproteobacteria bacterium]